MSIGGASLPPMRSSTRRKLSFAAAFAALLLLAGSALGGDPGPDEVTLKNGGAIRGTIVSSEPGTSVKILEVGQTQPRVIPWNQVADVERGKYAAQPPAQPGPSGPGYGAVPVPPPTAPPAPPAKMGDPGVVRLHIDTPVKTAVIESRSAVVGAYGGYGLVFTREREVCVSPCDAVLDGSEGHSFRLQSDAYPLPGPFTFHGMQGDVTMTIKPGSKGLRTGGSLGITFGVLAAVTGAILIPVAQSATVTDTSTWVDVSVPNRGLRNAGIGLLAGGVAALGAGIALFVTGATHTKIEQRPAKTARVAPRYWMGEF
jgi:hypothetical protein